MDFIPDNIARVVPFAFADEFPFQGTLATRDVGAKGMRTKTLSSLRLWISSLAPAIQNLCLGEARAFTQSRSLLESGSGIRDPSESDTRAVSMKVERGRSGGRERGKRS